jgi:hypothetical protein
MVKFIVKMTLLKITRLFSGQKVSLEIPFVIENEPLNLSTIMKNTQKLTCAQN